MVKGRYLPRLMEKVLDRAARRFPAVVLTGPRQSGKTTILSRRFGNRCGYVTLDDPKVRRMATEDPELFLETFPAPLIIAEIQYAPGLLPYIKIRIDRERSRCGRFFLTGSQHFPLMEGVTESLAGRAAVLVLLSLTWSERTRVKSAKDAAGWAEGCLRGGFPALWSPRPTPASDTRLWYSSYLQTYLERDVRSIRQVADLGLFQAFLQTLAARSAQLLNMSDLSRDLGVSVNTIKLWMRVLEASHQIVILRPYHRNRGKRLVKSPKVYFLDTGLLCNLLNIRHSEDVLKGPMAGAIFETAVFGELYRGFMNAGETPAIFFWRTAAGHEVDFVIERGRRLIPIEAKLTKTTTPGMAAGLDEFRRLFPAESEDGALACLADALIPLTRHVKIVPFADLHMLTIS